VATQLGVLREWAQSRGFEVAREFVTEDSAWATGNGSKGKEFDRQRAELLAGAKRGEYGRVLLWALDRLSRRGIKDTIGILDDLDDAGAVVCSHQESWLETGDPRMRQLIIAVMSWMSDMESERRSQRIKAGKAARRAKISAGLVKSTVGDGGSAKGRRLRKGSGVAGARALWSGPEGEARKAALAERNRQRAEDRRAAEG
jgi:DNA invertase Pin-like site-specific DNA recombinase